MVGWIGVDLDGTVFTYHKWVGWNVFGEPIRPMIERIQSWVREGRDVRVVTARIGLPLQNGEYSSFKKHDCRVTGVKFSDFQMAVAVREHCRKHVEGWAPRVQCYKDVDMTELWDDRAVQVIPNTGRTLAEEHEAVLSALRGKAQDETMFERYDPECIPGN